MILYRVILYNSGLHCGDALGLYGYPVDLIDADWQWAEHKQTIVAPKVRLGFSTRMARNRRQSSSERPKRLELVDNVPTLNARL